MSKLKKGTFFDKIVLLKAILLMLGLLLGTVAGKFEPKTYWYIAFFGLAYPYFLLANILMVVWLFFKKKWTLMLVIVAVIALGWKVFNATIRFSGNNDAVKKDSTYVRMMTYNVHNFKIFGEDNNENVKERMFQVVQEQNPDIICFQEFYSRFKGRYKTVDSLKQRLNMRYVYFDQSIKNDYEAYGLAIFSRYPIKNKGRIVFSDNPTGNESIFVDLEIKGKIVRVYNVHLQSISFDKQDYVFIDKITEQSDGKLHSAKRILRMLKYAFQKRSEQIGIMKKHMASCNTPYIIAGDFNDTPASYAVTQLTESLNNAFAKQGIGLGTTYNGKFPNFQIDYIATTKNIDVMNYHITKAKLSDHFPVCSDLKLEKSTVY